MGREVFVFERSRRPKTKSQVVCSLSLSFLAQKLGWFYRFKLEMGERAYG